MKALLVGFKKYANHDSNPSERILTRYIGKKGIQTVLLEASYEKAKKNLEKAIAKDKPDFVLVLNLSPFHKHPTLEQYGYNEMDSIQPDENGTIKTKEEILPGESKSLSTSYDLSRFNQVLIANEIESSMSIDGGRFFDNEAYYIALHSGVPSLMVHLPLESECSLEEDEMLINAILEIVSKNA